MKWNNNLYIGESVKKNFKKIKWKINHNAGMLNVHIITFPSNKENLLDIIPARELLQKGYPKNNIHILGLAGDYDEAVDLVKTIVTQAAEDGKYKRISDYIESLREDV